MENSFGYRYGLGKQQNKGGNLDAELRMVIALLAEHPETRAWVLEHLPAHAGATK